MRFFIKTVTVLLLLSSLVDAKRVPPPEVKSVMKDGIEYKDYGNSVKAIDIKSGEEILTKEIFVVVYNPMLERDVQDVHITNLMIEENKLIVDAENDNSYELDLETLKVEVTSGCQIIQDECEEFLADKQLNDRLDKADLILSQGYDFTKAYGIDEKTGKAELKVFGQKGYIKAGENKNGCANIIWNDGSKDHTLYSSKYKKGKEKYNGKKPIICEVDGNPDISLLDISGDDSKVMIKMTSFQGDAYGGTGESIVGGVCEIDFKAKKLVNCNLTGVGVH